MSKLLRPTANPASEDVSEDCGYSRKYARMYSLDTLGSFDTLEMGQHPFFIIPIAMQSKLMDRAP